MNMNINRMIAPLMLGATLLSGAVTLTTPALAMTAELETFIGDEPLLFDTPEQGVAAFKDVVAKGDLDALAKLLGLDAAKLKSAEGVADILSQIRDGASRKLLVEEEVDQRILKIGSELWTFPFPLTYGEDKKWAFDTVAGIEEIVNRRIGENEIQAINTARLYVDAQQDYATEDRDADGVLEFARKLISTESQTDGLYWPLEQGDGESPVGPFISQADLDKAAAGEGYFGYNFRILTGQGSNIAGGSYDYVINDNMIAGFGLIAWPAKYAQSGVNSFVINHAGIVYEKDLGADTAAAVEKIQSFDPDATWEVVQE